MGKAFALLILSLLILISGCTASTGNVAETTKLGMPETPAQITVQETIDELHKEFEEFEKSQTGNLPEENESIPPTGQNETQDEAVVEDQEETAIQETEEVQNNTEEAEATPEEETATNESVQRQCPSCEDNDSCTTDSCSEQTDFECVHKPVLPCCGNGGCEGAENWSACPQDCECSLDCGPCETPDNETCSCLPETECLQDGCCPEGCAYPGDPDCPKPSAIFSEIIYNPTGPDPDHEWIEVYNNGTVPLDITKLKFEESGTQHNIKNITGATLNPDSYCIIAENATQFLSDYPGYAGLLFDSAFSLSNSGEELVLRTGKDGEIMDTLFYSSMWGGNGFSLEKIDMNGPNTQENWNSSAVEGGTPGLKNSISI
jgi:hypothetical protein